MADSPTPLPAALDAAVGTMARRRTRVVFAPIALVLVAVSMTTGLVAAETTLLGHDDAQHVARLALTLFYCSVPFAAVLSLRSARKRRLAALAGAEQAGGLRPFLAKAAAEESRGAGWSRVGLALAFGWLHLGIVAWVSASRRPETIGGAGLVAAGLLVASAFSGVWLRAKLSRGTDPAVLAKPAGWTVLAVIIGFGLAIWRNPQPEAHIGALVAWLAFMRDFRGRFCAGLVKERAALAATPERLR